MNNNKPASARQATLFGVLMLVVGLMSLMVMNPTVSASVTSNLSATGAPARSVS